MSEKVESGKEVNTDELEVVNNIGATPTIYVDGLQGFMGTNNAIKTNLYQLVQELGKPGEDAPLRKVIVARLVMAPETAHQIGKYLLERIQVETSED